MHDFILGLTMVMSLVALVLSYRAYKRVTAAFHIVNNRATRTVTVDMNDNKITVIKEYKNEQPVNV